MVKRFRVESGAFGGWITYFPIMPMHAMEGVVVILKDAH